MVKTILAHLTGTAVDESTLSLTLDIARLHLAHIECLHVGRELADSKLDFVTSNVLAEAMVGVEAQRTEHRKRAAASFGALCAVPGVTQLDQPPTAGGISAAFRERAGDEADTVIADARFNDLVVLAGGASRKGRLSTEAIGRIIVECGRPVVLAPETIKARTFNTVAIAWRNTPDASRALSVAMPMLAKASRVEVISANKDDDNLECENFSEAVVRQLQWHNLNATSTLLLPGDRKNSEAVLEAAYKADADLLVMGGFGHSRLREAMFGGFTRRILEGANIPVLLFH